MAFRKTANAAIVKPAISMAAWDDVRSKAQALGSPFQKREASKVGLQKYNPNQFMFSHCTIIASVDTEDTKTLLGKQMVDGFEIDRRYSDYFITPETSKFINNNFDSWERKLLLATFRTFIGGENYVEHLQIPELSKGKIIDAAARDIGESVYVDILVATDLKHKPLINAIKTGQLQTLSMGCSVTHTTCSKCGNVAEDEIQLCNHIRYMKGNSFLDGLGKTRKIAELCGHITAEPGSVKFIEASWVANPAFTGAVLRDILSPQEYASAGVFNRMQLAFSQGPRIADPNLLQRAASLTHKLSQFGDQGQQDFADKQPAAKESDPLDKAVSDLAKHLRDKAVQKVKTDIDHENLPPRADLSEIDNNNLIRQSSKWQKIARVVQGKMVGARDPKLASKMLLGLLLFKRGGWKEIAAEKSFTGKEVLGVSSLVDSLEGTPKIAGEKRIYATILAVGGMSPYVDENSYLAACRRVVGRDLTTSEKDALISKGRLYDLGS